MIADQLTRVQIAENAVSRWWSFPTLLDPHGLLLFAPFEDSLPSVSFSLSEIRWTGQPSSFRCCWGSSLGKRCHASGREGVDAYTSCIEFSFESKTCWRDSSWRIPLPSRSFFFISKQPIVERRCFCL